MRKPTDARKRLMIAAAQLFVEQGFEGASVREICAKADTTINMVHYYFDSKKGLYDAIINQLSEDVFKTPINILCKRPKSREEFQSLIELFADATLSALSEHKNPYILARRERISHQGMLQYQETFVNFIEQAKTDCLVRDEVDAEMLSGMIAGRLADQVIDADWIKKVTGTNIDDPRYRKRWIDANTDIFLNGMLTK